jgi:hypothetical protein
MVHSTGGGSGTEQMRGDRNTAERAVPGLGHDDVGGAVGLAEAGGRGVVTGPRLAAGDEPGIRCAVSVPQVIHMMSPPLAVILACLLGRSQTLDVEREHRAGTGGGLIQHPPQRLLPQRHVSPPAEPVGPGARYGFVGSTPAAGSTSTAPPEPGSAGRSACALCASSGVGVNACASSRAETTH